MGAHKVLANTHKHLWGQSKESHVGAPLRHAGAPLRPVHVGKVAGRADKSPLPPPPWVPRRKVSNMVSSCFSGAQQRGGLAAAAEGERRADSQAAEWTGKCHLPLWHVIGKQNKGRREFEFQRIIWNFQVSLSIHLLLLRPLCEILEPFLAHESKSLLTPGFHLWHVTGI